ncbi:hypothetical protein, partial [Enterococcus faecalis]|uniref:hypothetical protein n=1 Tax=Enterococcus faecalis TaxID=1351 RepID=UPI001C204EC8
ISENCSLIFGEFQLISEGVASVPAVYKFLSVEQKSEVIFVPRSFFMQFSNHNILNILDNVSLLNYN